MDTPRYKCPCCGSENVHLIRFRDRNDRLYPQCLDCKFWSTKLLFYEVKLPEAKDA